MKQIRRLIVPTDGSPHADVAVEHALDLAELLKIPLHAIYVVDQPSFQAFPPEALLVDLSNLIRKEANQVLEGVRRRAEARGVKVETVVREGHPSDEICGAATAQDLIVIATHGRRGLSRMLLGSVAESVIRHAPCPVLVIRHGSK